MGATSATWETDHAVGTSVDVQTRRYFSGGWQVEPTVYKDLVLDLYVGKWWTWWFMWGLNPSSPHIEQIALVDIDKIVTSLFTRKNPSPNPDYFIPLKISDTRSSTNPYDQQLLISSIGIECRRYGGILFK